MAILSDLKIAILVGDGVNQYEVALPREEFEKASVQVETFSKSDADAKAVMKKDWQIAIKVDKAIQQINTDEYDALLLPGGEPHIKVLRKDREITALIKQFSAAGKIIGVMSEGVLLLIDAEIMAEKICTALPSLREEIESAGGIWQEKEVIVDNGLVSCQCEDNMEEFIKAFLDQLREGVHQRTETII